MTSDLDLDAAACLLVEEARNARIEVEKLTDTYGQQLEGCLKLSRKIDAEIKFLTQKLAQKKLKESYVNCSNMPYLKSVGEASCLFPQVTSILTPFQPTETRLEKKSAEGTGSDSEFSDDEMVPTVIDVVANEGFLWVKVIARNAEGLRNNWNGNCEMSHRSLEEQLEELLSLAELCPVYFQQPTLAVYFANGVFSDMCRQIEKMGVKVFGNVRDDKSGKSTYKDPRDAQMFGSSNKQLESRFLNPAFINDFSTVNLDVSTLLALCSNLTHGSYNWIIPNSQILNMQIADEAQHAGDLKRELEFFLKGKRMVCCETANESFNKILNIVGGPSEKKRAEELMKSVEIVPDMHSVVVDRVPVSSAVKERSKMIFGTGYELKAVTVTSNLACVRSMRQMGVYFPVYAHVARALTEQKEKNATSVTTDEILESTGAILKKDESSPECSKLRNGESSHDNNENIPTN